MQQQKFENLRSGLNERQITARLMGNCLLNVLSFNVKICSYNFLRIIQAQWISIQDATFSLITIQRNLFCWGFHNRIAFQQFLVQLLKNGGANQKWV